MTAITVEVAYAKPDEQALVALTVPEGCTIETAIQQSGLLTRFPEIDLTQNAVGIFSKPATLDTPLKAKDRVEIYRPLLIDPKTARRLRAENRK